jgi:hypothetical protein
MNASARATVNEYDSDFSQEELLELVPPLKLKHHQYDTVSWEYDFIDPGLLRLAREKLRKNIAQIVGKGKNYFWWDDLFVQRIVDSVQDTFLQERGCHTILSWEFVAFLENECFWASASFWATKKLDHVRSEIDKDEENQQSIARLPQVLSEIKSLREQLKMLKKEAYWCHIHEQKEYTKRQKELSDKILALSAEQRTLEAIKTLSIEALDAKVRLARQYVSALESAEFGGFRADFLKDLEERITQFVRAYFYDRLPLNNEIDREKKAIHEWKRENRERAEFNGFVLEDRAKKDIEIKTKRAVRLLLQAALGGAIGISVSYICHKIFDILDK